MFFALFSFFYDPSLQENKFNDNKLLEDCYSNWRLHQPLSWRAQFMQQQKLGITALKSYHGIGAKSLVQVL